MNVSSCLPEQFGVIPITTQVLFLVQEVKMLCCFILRYFSLKFSCDQTIETRGLILRCKMLGVSIVLFSSIAN